MKKYILLLVALAAQINFAQNVFPSPSGNVGIGTTAPDEKLVINGNSARLKIQTATNPVVYNTYLESNYDSGNTFNIVDGGIFKFGAKEIGARTPDSYVNSYYGIGFTTNSFNAMASNVRMYINQTGNIGIGTINPSNKLDVNGTIHSKEVKVDMIGWSDFVFKKEYILPTLEEVEKHIAEKGHLENIPSEEEVLKNGVNLGEMNAKLLQKIEELTLYMIEMKKDISTLKQENKILKSARIK